MKKIEKENEVLERLHPDGELDNFLKSVLPKSLKPYYRQIFVAVVLGLLAGLSIWGVASKG